MQKTCSPRRDNRPGPPRLVRYPGDGPMSDRKVLRVLRQLNELSGGDSVLVVPRLFGWLGRWLDVTSNLELVALLEFMQESRLVFYDANHKGILIIMRNKGLETLKGAGLAGPS